MAVQALNISSNKTLVIAEIAQAHDGSLGTAHAYIDAVARAGANAIKFQTHIAEAESTPSEPWRVKFSKQDKTRYDYWRRMEFSKEQWSGLREHAQEAGLFFISSPFSIEAVELLEAVGVCAWKVGSGEVTNVPMLKRIRSTNLPILLSSGMSSIYELEKSIGYISPLPENFALMQCTSSYPCPPEKIGLNLLKEYRQRFNCAVGLSDHSGTIYPSIAAATLGAEVVEVHVTFSKECFGPDVTASITIDELRLLVDGVRFNEKMRTAVCKDELAVGFSEMRNIFGKSVVARMEIKAGTYLSHEHITVKKPGGGISPEIFESLIGRRINKTVSANHKFSIDDLEPIQ